MHPKPSLHYPLRASDPFLWAGLAWVAPAAGAVAGMLNMGVYAVAAAVGVVFLMPPTGGGVLEPLPAMMPLVASVVYAGIAGLVLAGLNRFTKNPVRNFLIVVPIAFVLSWRFWDIPRSA